MKQKQLQKTVETVVKGIKNQKAGDRFEWKAEWIKSLEAIYNKIKRKRYQHNVDIQ